MAEVQKTQPTTDTTDDGRTNDSHVKLVISVEPLPPRRHRRLSRPTWTCSKENTLALVHGNGNPSLMPTSVSIITLDEFGGAGGGRGLLSGALCAHWPH